MEHFCGCTNLIKIINIPENLIDMQQTFYGCTSLTNVNIVIPDSVEKFFNAFRDCINLSGEIVLKANLTGKLLENGRKDYEYCFRNASTTGNGIIVKCEKNLYNLFYDNNTNKISTWVCDSNSKINFINSSDI